MSNGALTMTAKREQTVSPSGVAYDWTSCLLSSAPSFTFQYGYIEERAILPKERGFWPAFWTWQADGVDRWIETDVYEFYSDNRNALYLTQHSSGENCKLAPAFDPSDGWHTYGADIHEGGTTFYLDGKAVCSTKATSTGPTNIITNLAVFADVPPLATTSTATKQVDYISAWTR